MKWSSLSNSHGPQHISNFNTFWVYWLGGVSPSCHRLPVPGHRVRPPREPPGLPAKEPGAGDWSRLRHRQQHGLHALFPAAASLRCGCGPGHGLLEPKTGLWLGSCFGRLFFEILSKITLNLHIFFSINLSSLIPLTISLILFSLLIFHLFI